MRTENPGAQLGPRDLLLKAVTSLSAAALIALFFSSFFLGGSSVVPSNFPDAWEVIWTIWWQKQVLANSSLSIYFTPLLFFPSGASLLLHATVEGMTLPLLLMVKSLPPERIYGIACAAAFFGNYLSARDLFQQLGTRFIFAVLAALLFTFHPYFCAHLAAGQLNFLCFFPVLCALRRLLRILSSAKISILDCLWFGIDFAALALFNLYYLYFSLLAFSLLALTLVVMRATHARIGLLLCPLLLCVALGGVSWKIIPVAKLAASHAYTRNHEPAQHSGDLLSIALPAERQLISRVSGNLLSSIRVNSGESAAYLGWTLLVSILLLAFKHAPGKYPRSYPLSFLLVALVFLILTLGPEVQFAGAKILENPLYQTLESNLPAFPSVPARFAVMYLCLAFCAAAAFMSGDSFTRGRQWLSLTIFALAAIEYAPRPIEVTRLQAPTSSLALVQQCWGIHAVHDVAKIPQSAMLRQIVHTKAITAGFLSRRPREAERALRNNSFVRYIEDGKRVAQESARSGLERMGAQAVIVEAENGAVRERLNSLPWLSLFAQDDQVSVYILSGTTCNYPGVARTPESSS